MIGIYKITNKANSKIYIGQSHNVEERWKRHKKRTHNEHLKKAFAKYGIENFLFEILISFEENSETQNNLNTYEKLFIEQFDSTNPNKGYNKKEGGSKGKFTEETKKKLSEIMMGHTLSEETKQKISETLTGKQHTEETKLLMSEQRKGHPVSEETRKKISKSEKGKIVSEETRRKIREKGKGRKHSEETIKKIIAHNIGVPLTEEHKEKLRQDKLKESKKVLCVETNEIFNNSHEASKKYNISSKQINNCCGGFQKTAGGKTWFYLDEENKIINNQIEKENKNFTKVLCVETNEVFNSIKEAVSKYGLSQGNISMCCLGKRNTCGGYHWKYLS